MLKMHRLTNELSHKPSFTLLSEELARPDLELLLTFGRAKELILHRDLVLNKLYFKN